MTDLSPRPHLKIQGLAWLALGVNALVSAIGAVFMSPDSAELSRFIFGLDWGNEIYVMAAIYIVALTLDVVVASILKGWRNRLIALAGVVVLLIPFVVLTWRTYWQ